MNSEEILFEPSSVSLLRTSESEVTTGILQILKAWLWTWLELVDASQWPFVSARLMDSICGLGASVGNRQNHFEHFLLRSSWHEVHRMKDGHWTFQTSKVLKNQFLFEFPDDPANCSFPVLKFSNDFWTIFKRLSLEFSSRVRFHSSLKERISLRPPKRHSVKWTF